jgi:hypothetical protein
VRVLRVSYYLLRRPLLDDAPTVHNSQVVGQVGGQTQIMGDEEIADRQRPLQIEEQINNLGLNRQVQTCQRFIQDDHFRPGRQGSGNSEPLPLPPAKFGWNAFRQLPR